MIQDLATCRTSCTAAEAPPLWPGMSLSDYLLNDVSCSTADHRAADFGQRELPRWPAMAKRLTVRLGSGSQLSLRAGRGSSAKCAQSSMIVVDASAIIEVMLRTRAATAVERRVHDMRETLHAPHLIDIEVAHVIRRSAAKALLPQTAAGRRSKTSRIFRCTATPMPRCSTARTGRVAAFRGSASRAPRNGRRRPSPARPAYGAPPPGTEPPRHGTLRMLFQQAGCEP